MTYDQLKVTLQSTLARLAAVEEAVKQTPIVRAVTALRPEPGDIVVITMPLADYQRPGAKAAVAQGFQAAMPGARIAVMPDTMAVNILGPRKVKTPGEALTSAIGEGLSSGLLAKLDKEIAGPGFEAHNAPPRPSV